MTHPLVSVIIPSYNYGHLILNTIDSVLEQTYPNIECIIIDDGSTDDTENIIHKYLKLKCSKNIKYYRINNSGTSIAKNIGLKYALGEFIQFLDADDLLMVEKISTQINYITKENLNIVFSPSNFFEVQNGQFNFKKRYPKDYLANKSYYGKNLLSKLIENNIMTISAPLVRKEIILKAGLFIPSLKNNEDWLFWLKIALITPAFVYLDTNESGVNIRLHAVSAMNNHNSMYQGEVIVREHIDKLLNESSLNFKEFLIKKNNDALALHRIRCLQIKKGFKYVLKEFYLNPLININLVCLAFYKIGIRFIRTILR